MAKFKFESRYGNASVVEINGNRFIPLRQPLELEEDSGDEYVRITQDLIKRPDLISYKAYGTPDLFWVIYDYNNIRDPIFDLRSGQILKIPNINRVLEKIAENAGG